MATGERVLLVDVEDSVVPRPLGTASRLHTGWVACWLAAVVALLITPIAAPLSALAGVCVLALGWRSVPPMARWLTAFVVVASVATTAAIASPLGQALVEWGLD